MAGINDLLEALEESKKKSDAFKAENEALNAQVEATKGRLDKLEGLFTELESKSKPGDNDPTGFDVSDAKKFDMGKFMYGIYKTHIAKTNSDRQDAWKGAEYELEVTSQTTQKALDSQTDTAGGFLVPGQVLQSEFIELLRNKLVLEELGARMINNLTGDPVEIPGQAGGASGYWLGETEKPTESQPSFDMKKLTPKRCGAFVKASNRLLKSASVSGGIMQLILADMAAVLARTWQRGVLLGTGNKQPRGLIITPGVQSYQVDVTNGGVFDFDDMNAMVGLIEDADADELGEIRVLMHNKVKRKLKELKIEHYTGQTTGQPYLLSQPPSSDASLADSLGYLFKTTNQLPTNITKGANSDLSYVIVAVWSELIMGMWRNLGFRASDVTGDASGNAMLQDQVWLVAHLTGDSTVRQESAFVVCADAKTS